MNLKILKNVFCIILAALMLSSLCACSSSKTTTNYIPNYTSIEDAVRNQARIEAMFMTIGGNNITSGDVSIAHIERISEIECKVSGKATMTDIYGTKWVNEFYCYVKRKDSGGFSAGSFQYPQNKWYKQ